MFNMLKDPKIHIRKAGVGLVSAFFDMIEAREEVLRKEIYKASIIKIQADLTSTEMYLIHSGFLLIETMIKHCCRESLIDIFPDICDKVMKKQIHKSIPLKIALVSLIPCLASYDPEVFSEKFLISAMSFLKDFLLKGKEKGDVFKCLAELMRLIPKKYFSQHVAEIIKWVNEDVKTNKLNYSDEIHVK